MTSSDTPVVALEAVVKRYGRTTAVERLDLDVATGEFVTLLGPSGCGKSTTLRMIGGFETPTAGRIRIGGDDVTRLPPNRRDVNMVFQDYALFPHLSVARNVGFGLELQGRTRREVSARVDELLALLELEGLRDRAPDQLSGGQRQRVALARALARDPKLLLLDEPLGALDARLRAQLQRELKTLQRRTGKTFVFVTHDQDEALTMSDRIVVMNAGRIEQSGTPEALYRHPASRFVANFVGESNLIEGRVRERRAERVLIDWHGQTIAAPAGADRPSVGDRVTLAIRPEDIRVRANHDGGEGEREGLPARVIDRLYRGNRTSVTLAIGDRDDVCLEAWLDPERLGDAERVRVDWPLERVSVLSR